MSTSEKTYHHGDLRAALLDAAIQALEAGEPFSLRAVARRAGVSPAAPYRHFADREALDSAVAVAGFTDLRTDLSAALARTAASSESVTDVIADLGIAYVGFAVRRPAVFRLMFGNGCDEADSDRVKASAELHALLSEAIERLLPEADVPNLSTALWSLAHGLAFLHLDGKLRPESADAVAARVRSAVAAIFAVSIRPASPVGAAS